ncbi:hypothetical protein PG994_013329 [Apiospora phragmitis]|uniref:Uncharacterized protein n=1 Tax=Apiospora phragmitis TaxID=2905665 RepID=A0ABR1TA15_9PEZI
MSDSRGILIGRPDVKIAEVERDRSRDQDHRPPHLISAAQVKHMQDYMSDQISADECAARLTQPSQGLGAEGMSDAVFAIHTFINHSAVSNLPYQTQML